jgi:hypothetical protein
MPIRTEWSARKPQASSERPEAGNPDPEEDGKADQHDDTRDRALPVGGTEALQMSLVKLGASYLLVRQRRAVAEVLKVPRPTAKTPSSNFRSGNEVAAAAHTWRAFYRSTASE